MIFYKDNDFDYELFKNPTAEYRGLPFWSWNCRINKDVIDEQLEIFKNMGFGGVVIHPRDGLDIEYLGDEYMDMIQHTVTKCRQMGLLCWLYDDDRFPSGAADGKVTKNPNYRARELMLTKKRLGEDYTATKTEFDAQIKSGKIPSGYFCTAYSIEIRNKHLAGYRRLNSENEIAMAVKNGENVRFAYVKLHDKSEWFQGQTYIDTMNPQAVDEFIKVTHESYKNTLGADFGTAASAIFTDEPRIGKQGLISFAESDEDVFVPYTEYFAERFKAEYGLDPLDIVPEYIWDRADGDMHSRYIYRDMTKECFANAFMDKISKWCGDNGILMTGHILGEENPTSQTTTVGDAMRTYKNMDIPGVDILIDNRELSTVKQAASVAAQYGRKTVMSELYGVTNWDCTFKTYKLQGDWQAALGISIRVPHLSHMSLLGEAKRDWPASIFYQSPWYKEYPYIENHFSRLNTVLTRGKRVTKIAVLHSVESMWVRSGNSDITKIECKHQEKRFKEVSQWLLYNTLDYDYLSESLLKEQDIKYGDNCLWVGMAKYNMILIPNFVTVRGTTLDILEKFANQGGKVVFMGDIPEYIYGKHSSRAVKLAEKCICIPHDEKVLIDTAEYLRDVKIVDLSGKASDNLFYHLREDSECKWLFISHVNKNDSMEKENYTITIKGEYDIVLYDTITGERVNVPSVIKNGYTILEWSCYGEDSMLLQLNADKSECEKYISSMDYEVVQKITEIEIKRAEKNVVLLDMARFCVDGGEIQKTDEILRVDNKIRKQLGFTLRCGSDRQPWATDVGEEHSVTLFYEIHSKIDTAVQLGIENPQKCRIYLNGEKADTAVTGYYADKDIKVINLPDIRKGVNQLEIRLMYNNKTMLENMYVLGDFDVQLDGGRAVIAGKSTKSYGDTTKQGMPFYTGNLEYTFEFDVDEDGEYCIRIPQFKAPVIRVWIDGVDRGIIAYAAHRLNPQRLKKSIHKARVVMYGNRFNSFGALHNANENYLWYGNGSYRTTGDEWTYDYMLRSVGIMSEIEIERVKM